MSTPKKSIAPPTRILIVGCGAFGSSTALHLLRTTYSSHPSLITILDRSADPPSLDSASSDHNKIIRQDYADTLYAKLANESISEWRTSDLFKQNFFECGVVVGARKGTKNEAYVKGSMEINMRDEMGADGKSVRELKSREDWKRVYRRVETADKKEVEGNMAYYNQAGGWADSRQAVVDIVSLLRSKGVNFVHGEAESLLYSAYSTDEVIGVKTSDGRTLEADLTILSSGAWTSRLLPELKDDLLPTGQVVATIQLNEKEAEMYRDAPVSLFLDTGFYAFPPSRTNLIKIAIHSAGYLNPTSTLPSTPRTSLTPGYESQQIPSSAQKELRSEMSRCYPALKDRTFEGTRLCWYTDRKSGDWLIDYHPSKKGLFVASGGSGHAFKFLPKLGEIAVKGLERSLGDEAKRIWSWKGVEGRKDKSREGREKSLYLDEETGAKDKAKL